MGAVSGKECDNKGTVLHATTMTTNKIYNRQVARSLAY